MLRMKSTASVSTSDLTERSSIIERDGGQKIEIRDFRGETAVVDLGRICPDGDALTSPEKRWLYDLIHGCIYRTFNADPANCKASYIYAQACEQLIWAYWLLGRGVTCEEEITDELLGQFLSTSMDGIDVLFDSRHRIWEALRQAESEMGRDQALSMSVSDIYRKAGLAPSLSRHLQGANLAIRQFKDGEKQLPKWKARERPINRGTLSRKASAIRAMHVMFSVGGEHLDRFDASVAEARAGCGDGGATRLIPQNLAIRLLDQAVLWVFSVNPVLMNLREKLRVANLDGALDESTGKSAPGDGQSTTMERQRCIDEANEKLKNVLAVPLVDGQAEGINVSTAINIYAPTADWIVTGALTARRAGELESLSHGAISGDEVSGWWIRTYIGKTLQKPDLTPCPRIVVEAIHQLEVFSKDVRDRTGSAQLMNVRLRDGAKAMRFALRENLNKFSHLVGAQKYTLNGVEDSWVYAPHQLRKLFAVLYVWRYDAGDIYALAYHLRHFNIRMTMRYCYDEQLAREISYQTMAFTKSKLRDYATNAKTIAGVYGKRLKKLVQKAMGNIELATEHMLDRKLTNLIKDRGISLKATAWGFCGCKATPSNMRRAACQKPDCRSSAKDLDGTPDPSGSDEVRCAGCLFFATDGSRKKHWGEACNSAKEMVERPESSRLQVIKFEKRLKVLMAIHGTL